MASVHGRRNRRPLGAKRYTGEYSVMSAPRPVVTVCTDSSFGAASAPLGTVSVMPPSSSTPPSGPMVCELDDGSALHPINANTHKLRMLPPPSLYAWTPFAV